MSTSNGLNYPPTRPGGISATNTIIASHGPKTRSRHRKVSLVKKEKKKMGWFKRKFAQWSREAWENSRSEEVYATDTIRGHDGISGKSSVRFTIYPASGGFVIEHYKQDRYKENDGPTLTIVNNSDSIGTAVEHILTMEALKS